MVEKINNGYNSKLIAIMYDIKYKEFLPSLVFWILKLVLKFLKIGRRNLLFFFNSKKFVSKSCLIVRMFALYNK